MLCQTPRIQLHCSQNWFGRPLYNSTLRAIRMLTRPRSVKEGRVETATIAIPCIEPN